MGAVTQKLLHPTIKRTAGWREKRTIRRASLSNYKILGSVKFSEHSMRDCSLDTGISGVQGQHRLLGQCPWKDRVLDAAFPLRTDSISYSLWT